MFSARLCHLFYLVFWSLEKAVTSPHPQTCLYVANPRRVGVGQKHHIGFWPSWKRGLSIKQEKETKRGFTPDCQFVPD